MGCRQVRPVAELVRVGRRSDGTLALGRSIEGRGAWLCRGSVRCLDQAVRHRSFERAFRVPVDPDAVRALRGGIELDG